MVYYIIIGVEGCLFTFTFLSRAAMNLLKYVSFAVAILAVNFPISTAFADTR